MALRLLPIEKAAAVYCAATSVLMVIMMPRLVEPERMALMRIAWLAMTLALAALSHYLTSKFAPSRSNSPLSTFNFPLDLGRSTLGELSARACSLDPSRTLHFQLSTFLRTAAQLAWLILWYPDTYEFNRCFPNLDHHFAQLDLSLFGCQPSLLFSQLVPSTAWAEAFCMGYWCYFPMIALLSVVVLCMDWRSGDFTTFKRVTATIITAFFLYYCIYIFLPVAGPQYYFHAVGVDEIVQGHFPHLGLYFSDHTDLVTLPGDPDGLFHRLVDNAHATGERPTAAFPSSHIGISTILLLLARRHAPWLIIVLLPLWALLCCATVYIQAHYLVDAIAGLISAPLILYLAEWMLRPFLSRQSRC